MPRLSLRLLSNYPNYFNFPKKFVERQERLGEVWGHHVRVPQEREPQFRVYDHRRPWTDEWAQKNYPRAGMIPGEGRGKRKALREVPYVEPIIEPLILKGDRVEVQVGDDKGKIGVVRQLIDERNWCFVEGLNNEYSYSDDGHCYKQEKPLLVTTQVKLVDPVDERGCHVEWRFTEEGEKVRISTRSGRILPIPDYVVATKDFVHPSNYVGGLKDTDAKEVQEATYEPKLKSVEDDILDELGFVEERQRGKTYWY